MNLHICFTYECRKFKMHKNLVIFILIFICWCSCYSYFSMFVDQEDMVTEFQVKTLSSTSVLLVWRAPLKMHGIQHYKVRGQMELSSVSLVIVLVLLDLLLSLVIVLVLLDLLLSLVIFLVLRHHLWSMF